MGKKWEGPVDKLIPDVRKCMNWKWTEVDYYLTQAFSWHSCFISIDLEYQNAFTVQRGPHNIVRGISGNKEVDPRYLQEQRERRESE